MDLPRCGIYRTTAPIASVPANCFVYFHNHGDPGPGVYLPESWRHNRARFSTAGITLVDLKLARSLEPLAPQGLYSVEREFTCCAKKCVTYRRNMLVQLGYNGAAQPIVFLPRWTAAGLEFPKQGQPVDEDRLAAMRWLETLESPEATPREEDAAH